MGDKNALQDYTDLILYSQGESLYSCHKNYQYTHYVLWLSVQLTALKELGSYNYGSPKNADLQWGKSNFSGSRVCWFLHLLIYLNTQFAFAIEINSGFTFSFALFE